jgi:hypothetical protein
MPRTDAALVQGILEDNYNGSTSLAPFIAAANAMTSRVNTVAVADGFVLSSAELELIERWLAAHFYAWGADKTRASVGVGRSNETYDGKTGMHLEATPYGQTAIALDFSGTLRAINDGAVNVGGFWAGYPTSEQTDWVTRGNT